MSDDPAVDPIIRKTVSLPASLWAQIEDYQFAHRVKRKRGVEALVARWG